MDNNAFRKLINERQLTSQKSTKEIAREAVENEFRQKKQSRGGGRRSATEDYDSDSDNDNPDEELMKRRRRQGEEEEKVNEDEPEWKRRRRMERGTNNTSGYRDRAKERREGKNIDYNHVTSSDVLQNEDDKRRQAELSKFLGGDEEHTHLVKGLDKALAEKVRREEMGGGRHQIIQQEEDLDELLESAIVAKEKSGSKTSSIDRIQPKSDLGKSVLKYLQRKQHGKELTSTTTILQQQSIQRNTAKQNSIQRSQYTFSLDANIQKRHAAWDAPQLKMIGASSSSQLGERGSMTPLNGHLIATIKNKLDGTIGSKTKGKALGDVVDYGASNENGMKQQQSSVMLKKRDEDEKEVTAQDDNDTTEKVVSSSTPINKDDDDSDDDIFADVGAYVPPTANVIASTTATTDSKPENDASKTTATDPSVAKKQTSIFENLLANENSTNKLDKSQTHHQPMQLQNPQQQQQANLNNFNKAVIDRDVFGGSRKQDEQQQNKTRRRGPQTAAMEGVSMTNYSGGYGEEMDTDFLNEEEDVYRKMKRKDEEDGEDAADVVDDEDD